MLQLTSALLITEVVGWNDESSMLQMPVAAEIVSTDSGECRCPGYFQDQCEAEAAQGCIWTDAGDSNAHWCQCGPVPESPVTQPPVVTEPPAPICCQAQTAECLACQTGDVPGYDLLAVGVCRTADGGTGTHDTHTGVSTLDGCVTLCDADDQCVAIEYYPWHENGGNCELHHVAVTNFVANANVLCYVKPASSFVPEPPAPGICCQAQTAECLACQAGDVPGYNFLAVGVCRTADGGTGTHDTHTGVSTLDDCVTLCDADDQCVAIEYKPWDENGGNCELHHVAVTNFVANAEILCYVKS